MRGGRRRGPSWIVSVIRLAQSVSRKARYVFRRHVAEIDVHFPDNSAATVAQSGALASTVDQPEGSLADAFKRAWTRQGGLIDAGRTPAAPEDDQDGVTDTEMATSDLDLSRFSAAPSARLGHLPFECDRAFPAQC